MSDWIETYVAETSKVPSPAIYRLWSAITAISGAMERKTWTAGSAGFIYPNLFTLLVGPPATGKTNAIGPIRNLWAGIKSLNLAPDNVNKATLVTTLQKSLRIIIGASGTLSFSSLAVPASEFGVFFTNYDLEFLSVINHIYDNPPTYNEVRISAGERSVTKPHLVILAATQPDYLGTFLPEAAWGMGFTSRLILIYSSEEQVSDLFAAQSIQSDKMRAGLEAIFNLTGEFVWTPEAKAELHAWHRAGGPPRPTHSRLTHYVGRRSLHVVKLAMISSVSRSHEMIVTVEDVERGRDWLLNAEKTMPDIFRAMNQKSDSQIISELHLHLWRLWATNTLGNRKPLHEKVLYEFLQARIPSEKIAKIIEVAKKTGFISQATLPDEYIPNPIKGITFGAA